MNYVLIGADRRFEYLQALLQRDGHRVFLCENGEEVYRFADESGVFLLPFSASRQEQRRILEKAREGSEVIGGELFEENRGVVAERKLRYRNLASEEAFARANALPTAEGCLERLLSLSPFVLNGACVLVVGFGRIGSEVARLLRRCGAFVTVCGREGKSLREASKANFPVIRLGERAVVCPWRVIVNTVPKKKIVSLELIEACRELSLVLDLASGKGNVDTEALFRKGIAFESAGGLPGRYAPETAAFYLYEAIRSNENGSRKDGGCV